MRNDLITSLRQHALARRELAAKGHGTGWTMRRRVIAILRSAFRVIGMGRQRTVGMLGGAALGVLSLFAAPDHASAQAFVGNNSTNAAAPAATGMDSAAGGYGSVASGTQAVSVGSKDTVSGQQSTGLGNDVSVTGNTSIGIGGNDANAAITAANASGTSATYKTLTGVTPTVGDFTQTIASANISMAVGEQSEATADFSSVFGWHSRASAVGALAVGDSTLASGVGASAFGAGSTASVAGAVALGAASVANRAGLTGATENFSGTAVASTQGAVSVGSTGNERQISNVAGGTQATDAVNIRQLQAVGGNLAGSLGGGAAFNPTTGAYTAPVFTVAGTNYANVGSALNAITGGSTTAGVQYFHANSTGPDSSATGTDAIAVGVSAAASGTNAIAIGGSVAGGTNAAQALGASSVALGSQATANNAGDVALGSGSATAAAVATTGATIGGTAYTFAGTTPASTVSVGAPGAERTITNVAAGRLNAGSTDAVNGSQLYATNSAVSGNATNINTLGTTTASSLGGGTAYNPASGITGFSPMVAGGTQTTVAGALAALDTAARTQGSGLAAALGGGAATASNGTVTAPLYTVGAGSYSTVAGAVGALQTSAPIQYATSAAPTTPNAYNPSQNETLVGAAAGPVTLSNVAPGTLSTNSTQAVNGSQLYATNMQVTNNTAAITNATNGVTGPIQRGATANILTATATGGTAANPGAAQTLTNIAAGGLAAASTDAVNGSQLYATNQNVTALTNGTAGLVQQDPASRAITVGAGTNGTTIGFANNAGTARTLTGVAVGQVASGSTQAVDGGQLFGTAGSVAGALGGGSMVNPNGTVSAPTYVVGGQTYNNVGSALTASNGLDIQYTPNASGAATNAVDLTKGGTLAPVALTGLAAGALTPNSADAVNGAQLYATNQNVAGNSTGIATLGMTAASTLGSGATYNPATGITGFSSMVAGGTQTTVGGALAALNTAAQTQGTGLTAALGGGAAVAPNGTVTAPVFTVGAGNFGTVAGAIGALQTGAPVQYATAAAPTTANGFNASQNETLVGAGTGPVTLSNVAPATLSASSTQAVNGSQLYATNTQVANNAAAITSANNGLTGPIQRGATANALTATATGGTAATPGTAQTLTNIAAGGLSATSTDAVDGSQLYATNQSIAAIANGTGGLIQQDPTSKAIAIGANTSGTSVGFANNAGVARTLTGIAAGQVAATSTQAINGGQLFGAAGSVASALGGGSTVNPDGTLSAPAYTVGGQTYNNAGSALAASNGLAVQYTPSATGAATNTVDLTKGGALAPVALTGLAAGAVTATSTQAVNGSQLYATNTQVAANATALTNASNGLTGPIQRGATSNRLTATATGGTAANPGAAQTLTNIAAGSLGATSTDAVDGAQLYATNQNIAANGAGTAALGSTTASTLGGGATYNPATGITGFNTTVAGSQQTSVGGALTALDMAAQTQGSGLAAALGGGAMVAPNGTVTAPIFTVGGGTYGTVAGAIGALQTGAPLQYATAAAPTTPNGFNPSQNVTLVGAAAGPVTLSNIASGTLSGTSTQAVNGSQLYATNQAVASLSNGSLGLVQQATPTGPITIGATSGGTVVNVAGTAGPRLVTGLRTGTIDANSTDAVNGQQLYGTAQSVATALGGGSTVAANGALTAPSYSVQGTAYNSVGGAVGAIDGSLTSLNTAVSGGGIKYFHGNSTLADAQALGANSVAIGPQAIATNAGDVALGQGSTTGAAVATSGATIAGTTYGFAGAAPTSTVSVGSLGAERTLTNVAAGQLSGASTDAVNGSQLYATNQAVNGLGATSAQLGASTAASLGGGATYDPTSGKLAAPSYTVGQMAYNDVGSAVGALQTGGALQYSTSGAPTTANGYVRSQDATLVGAAAGPVILHNVGAGVASTDAANVGQLPGAFTSPTSNTFAFAQAGGSGAPVTVANVAAGLVSASSTQAVNGSQLYGLAQGTSTAINNLAEGFGQLQQEVASNDRRASAGTAIALAATGLHYDDRPGKFSVGAASAIYRGQVGVSAGLAHTSEDGHWRLNAAASFAPTDNKADIGAVVGASYSFN